MLGRPLASQTHGGLPLDTAGEPFGAGLQTYFDAVSCEPLPPRLLELAHALERAVERGDVGRRVRLD